MQKNRKNRLGYKITEWGGEFSPVFCGIESEFGIQGYQEILESEISALKKLIEEEGIGKDGERYAQPPLPSPEVTTLPPLQETHEKEHCSPQWNKRYNKKKRNGRWQLSSSLRPVKIIGDTLKRGSRGIAWSIAPPPEKINSPSSLLIGLFQKNKHLLCLNEQFWLANKKLARKFFSIENRTILKHLHAPMEHPQNFAVPLKRFNNSSLEGWLRCQNMCDTEDYLLIMQHNQLPDVASLFSSTGQAPEKVLIIAERLSETPTLTWTTTTQIDKQLWLVEGLKLPSADKPVPSVSPIQWPKISVIVVSYNQAAFIRDCLDSILNQDYPDMECIVVDGESTDGTVDILEAYRGRLTHLIIEPDKCQSEALNKGFRLATGDIMTWVCSDDFLENGALIQVARAFSTYQTDLVAGGCRVVGAAGENLCNHQNGFPIGKVSRLSFGDLLSFIGAWELGLYFYQPDLFFSRSIWEKSGAYIKEHLHFAMDYDLFLRFAMAGATISHIPEYLAVRRIHAEQKTIHKTMTYLPTIRNLMMEYQGLIAAIIDTDNNYPEWS